jgi:type VI secretion system secreted protein VgrG
MGDFRLEVEGVAAPAIVRAFTGKERLNRPHAFRVVVTFEGLDEPAISALIGVPATLRFEGHAEARRVGGVLTEVALLETTDGGRSVVEVVLSSRLARLRERRTSRIHQDASVPTILKRVLDLHGIPHVLDLARTHDKLDTCAQYRESDLDFITRLCAEHAIAFFVADAEEGHAETVVFCDAPASFPDVAGSPQLEVPAGQVDDDAMGAAEHHARVSAVRRRTGTSSALVQRYDPLRPMATLRSTAKWTWEKIGPGAAISVESVPGAVDDPGLLYEHHADVDDVDVTREVAATMLAQRRRRSFEIELDSACVRLGPGRRVKLEGPEWDSASGQLLLKRVDHTFRAEGLTHKKGRYQALARAVPGKVFPHPKLPERRPVEVTQTGVVVGPEGEEIFTDEHGRVRVQLHWDLDGRGDAASSAWIRVAQAWAGNGFGTMHLPRVGMEVLVSFLGGDPDRPVVIGCLHHAAHPPPFALPAARTVSGILSRSSPGGGGSNEVSLQDAKGKELVRVRSERDVEVASKHDTRVEVGNDRTTSVRGDDTLIVTGTRTVRVSGGLDLEIQGDSRSLALGDVAGTFMGKHDLTFQDVASTHFEQDVTTTCAAGMTVHVEGEASLVVGTGETLASASVDGRLVLGASKTLSLRAEESIVLQVGTTVLEVTADGLRVNGKTISLSGETITAAGDGPKLTLSDETEILTGKMTILTRKGGLVMEDKTELWGQPLALNPPPHEKKAEAGAEEPKTKPFKLKLSDAMMEPYGGKTFVLFAAGQKQQGTTGGDGSIDLQIPEEATQVDVTCWLDEFPTGRKSTWSIDVAELEPPSSLPGAMTRLHNLGYYQGAIPEKAGPNEQAAIRWFQKDHELEPTGELDGATSSELESVHGS